MAAPEPKRPRCLDHDVEVADRATYDKARLKLLEKEKEAKRAQDEVAKLRRQLPWIKVEQDYVFAGPDGDVSISALFGDSKNLIIYHFMFDPSWENPCSLCSFWADGFSGILPHLRSKTAFAVVAKAPQDKLAEVARRKDWTFTYLSSADNTFNSDFGVEFDKTELGKNMYNFGRPVFATQMPGASVFRRDEDGAIYHTYSTFARGLESFNVVFGLLDMLPDGRDEKNNMDFVKHIEEY